MDAINFEEILAQITEKAKKQNELIRQIRELQQDIERLKITEDKNPCVTDIIFNTGTIHWRELPIEKRDLISNLVREGLEEKLKDSITKLINL